MPKPDNPKQTKTKAQAMLIDIKIPKKHTFHWFMAADKKMQANKKKGVNLVTSRPCKHFCITIKT